MKKLVSIIAGIAIAVTTIVSAGNANVITANADVKSSSYYDDFRNQTLTGKSAWDIVAHMSVGWNLGNTFDSSGGNLNNIYSFETSWGCPQVTKEFIDGVAAQGFDTIRIPVTWCRAFTDKKKHTISKEYLARVKEVVDMAYDNNLYVILNMHHETWLNNTGLVKNKKAIGKELVDVWKQLADYFGDYDQHLIFESMNEPRYAGADNEWIGDEAGYKAVNYLNKKFVKTIRSSSKKYNKERALMIPAYAAKNSGAAVHALTIPKINGKKDKNIIIEAHSYDPYNLGISGEQTTFDPESSADTNAINTALETLDYLFLSNKIPVIIDECSAVLNNNTEERVKWAKYYTSKAAAFGIPMLLWDNGVLTTGYESHGHFDRYTGESRVKEFTKAFVETYKNADRGSLTGSTTVVEESSLGGELLYGDSNGIKMLTAWSNAYVSCSLKNAGKIKSNKKIAVTYTGTAAPKLILVSESRGAWWISIDATSTATSGKKKVAYYSYSAISKACKENGVEKMADISRADLVAVNDQTVFYELALLDK